jgi:hypothetical protein
MVALKLAGFGLGLALFASLAPTPAAAQHACQDDAFRLCSQFIPDRGRVASCLRRSGRQLSPACRTEMRAFQPRTAKKVKKKKRVRR